MLAFIGGIGTTELIIILVIMLLIFGSRLPKVMRSLGQSVNEFKKGVREAEQDVNLDEEEEQEPYPGDETPAKNA